MLDEIETNDDEQETNDNDAITDEEQTNEDEETSEDIEETTTDNDDNEYVEKIAELDARLSAFKAQKVDATKREQMKQVGYTDDQIERYISHVKGESIDDIKASISELMNEIPAINKEDYADPNIFNGMNTQPTPTDGEELGRSMFANLLKKGKIRR